MHVGEAADRKKKVDENKYGSNVVINRNHSAYKIKLGPVWRSFPANRSTMPVANGYAYEKIKIKRCILQAANSNTK